MKLGVTGELIQLCKQIVDEQKSEVEWALIESDDMFKADNIEGGFDAVEIAFCFSIFIDSGEYWFQLSLMEVEKVYCGHLTEIDVRHAE